MDKIEERQRLRVLHVKKMLDFDGATIVEYRIASALSDEVVFDWFLTSDERGRNESQFEKLGSRIYHTGPLGEKYGTASVARILYHFLKDSDYDIVYFDTDYPGRAYLSLMARFAGVRRRIIHSHNSQMEMGGGSTSSRHLPHHDAVLCN